MVRKDFIVALLCTLCLTITLLAVLPSRSQSSFLYDPWADINDDGKIDMKDIGYTARLFGTTGEAINKTALLLEIQSRVTALETRVKKKGHIAISPAAFVPMEDGQAFSKWHNLLRGSDYFWTSLQLPNGVTLRNITAHVGDFEQVGQVSIYLYGYNLTMVCLGT